MQRIYFDNAATTSLDPEVLAAMMPYLTEKFGNPSSIYSYGRETKIAVETARKSVAKALNAKPSEIFFTSGGTESTNTAIWGAILDLNCTHIISSKIEHHATLHMVEDACKAKNITTSYVNLLPNGQVDLLHLEHLLATSTEKTLVTLMHANNEIGNILDAEKVGVVCKKYAAIYHSDSVQTLAHYPLDVKQLGIHFMSGAGHKFHGPKGVGILFISEDVQIKPLLQGGSQERNMRAGTENVYGIVGFAKALEISLATNEQDKNYILSLKKHMITALQKAIPNVVFNGDYENGLYTVLNVGMPNSEKAEMLLYSLDMAGICVSGGSACSSGANSVSHVIQALADRHDIVPIRFSFCKHNTIAEIDICIAKIKEILG
jgi:cysteine desulfurase